MLIESPEAFKLWLVNTLAPISDADPDVLAKYVIALVKKDKSVGELIATCQDQLDIFLQEKTNSFVKLLFEVLSSGEYDASLKAKLAAAKAAPPVTKEPVVIPVTRVPASNSGSSIGSHGDVDMRLSRPGAVVQPLVSGNNGMSEEDYRHGDVYRSGHDTHQHGEPQQRRDWKRRSPQRTGSPSGVRPVMSTSGSSRPSDRMERRQHLDSDAQKARYSPAPYHGTTRPSDGRRRSRSRSRSRPLARRRSRSPSASSQSSSSSVPSKRRRMSGGSPGREKTLDARLGSGNRCRDYDERGYCVRGDLCPYDHGLDRVVLDSAGISASVLGLPGESTSVHVESSTLSQGVPDIRHSLPPPIQYHPGLPPPYLPPPPPPHGMLLPPMLAPPPRLVPPTHVEPYLPEPFCPKPAPMRQPMLPLPVPPGHSAPTMLIGSMQWRPERGLRPPPPFVENSRPMMPPFDVGRGFSSTVMSTVRPANLIVVPTRRQEQQNDIINKAPAAVVMETTLVSEPPASLVSSSSTSITSAAGPAKTWHRHPGMPWADKQKYASNATLELRRVPPDMNNIAKINEHFARFGTLVNLQVGYDGDPEAALVSFASHAQASAAYRCSEPLFNNRFIKIFWHNVDRNNTASGTAGQQQTQQLKPSDSEVRSFPPAHQLQLNNRRKPVVTAATTTDTQSAPKPSFAAGVVDAVDVKKPKLAEVRPSPVAAATYVPVRPGALKLNMKDVMKKEAVKKRLEIQKQKQSLLQRQIQEQKSLLERLEKNKKMAAEEKAIVVDTVKKLAASIEKLKAELSSSASSKQSVAASKTGSQATGSKVTASVLVRPTKLVRTQPVTTSASEVTPSVTSSTTDSSRTDDKPADTSPSLGQAASTQKKILDSELELMSAKTESSETTMLRRRVAELKREAASLGLLAPDMTRPSLTPRGRGAGPLSRGVLASRTVDRRPRQLLVTGFTVAEKEDVLTHLLKFGDVDNSVIDTMVPSISIKYKTRQSAENAVSDGSVYNGKPLSMAWQTADGVLSPKIIVPPRSSEPQMRSMPTSKSQSHSSGSSSAADESQSRKTSISKLLEDDDDDDDDVLLGVDDDEDEDTDAGRSWRR